jgi:uncharacterized membrane protein
MLVAIALLIGFIWLLTTNSRIGRLDHRLNLLEEAVRTRLRQTPGDPLWRPQPAVEVPEVVAPAPPEVPVRALREPVPVVFAPPPHEPVEEAGGAPDVLPEVEPEPAPDEAPALPSEDAPESAPTPEPEPVAANPEHETEPEPVFARAIEPEPVAAPAKRSFSVNFEDLFGRRLPIWAGGITLAIAGVLIVKYAIAAGFFTPWIQAASGFLFGTGLIAGAEFASRNEDKVRDPRVRQALSGAGLATLYATILMAHIGYGLIGPLAAFAGMALVTAGALGLSIRFGPPSALLGLAGGLATPALVGSMQPDVPMLSVYLALTIGGLTAVSRMQRWAWLGISALLGGAGWSLWLVATGALDAVSTISVGGLVLLLAIGLPMLGFAGPRATLVRLLTALVGAGQLAMLVATGGFTPLNWGLFALIAVAGQWLSWREKGFEIVPSISLGLSAILLVLWPHPVPYWFTIIGGAMALIHGVPLMLRLWQVPPRFTVALELAALSLAILLVPGWHFYEPDGSRDTLFALLAGSGALLSAAGAGAGWNRTDRHADARFALLVATSAFLTSCAITLLVSGWFAPLGIAIVAAAVLFLGERSGDRRIETIATAFAAATLPALAVTGLTELPRLLTGMASGFDLHAVLRWGGLFALFCLFAVRPTAKHTRYSALTMAAWLAYGAMAQIIPGWSLPLGLALVAGVMLFVAQGSDDRRVIPFASMLALTTIPLLTITGANPLGEWQQLLGDGGQAPLLQAVLRWGGVAALFAVFAWRVTNREFRFVAHSVAAVMAYGAVAQLFPGWALPLALAGVSAALLLIARHRQDEPTEALAVLFAVATLPLLSITGTNPLGEWQNWLGLGENTNVVQAVMRWGSIAVLFALIAWRAGRVRLSLLAHAGAALMVYGTVAQAIPGWAVPLDMVGVALGLMILGGRKDNPALEIMATSLSLAAPALLCITGADPHVEWLRLVGVGDGVIVAEAIGRWAGVAALATIFAFRSRFAGVRMLAQIAATFFAYGTIAQAIPGSLLPIVPAAGLALISFAVRKHGFARFVPAACVLAAFVAGWAAGPVSVWTGSALFSLGGQPMVVMMALPVILKQLLIPALLMLFALWNARAHLPIGVRIVGAAAIALLGLVSLHSLYRIGFAHLAGSDFVTTGLAERVIWAGLLIAGGWALGRGAARGEVRFGASVGGIAAGTLHAAYYTLLLHNPLWAAQAVGAIPLANLLIPAFGLVPLGLWLMAHKLPELAVRAEPVVQLLKMVLVTFFAFATLRQGFAGTLLIAPGLADAENILRSILAIGLAIGFLLWGIRSKQRNWRIASLVLMLAAVAKVFLRDASGLEGLMRIGSFVALGFSLIGIGWLYSRQLRSDAQEPLAG